MAFIKNEEHWAKKLNNIRCAIKGTKEAFADLKTKSQIEAHEAQLQLYEKNLKKAEYDCRAWRNEQQGKMSTLDFDATLVFLKLIQDINDKTPSRRFDKHDYWPDCSGGFMAVQVEKVSNTYSIAHYYKQNGDLMADPEMTFVVFDGLVYPASFTQHNIGLFEESISWTKGGWTLDPALQKHHAEFANLWFENIKIQQDI